MTGIERKLTFLGSLWDLKTQTGFHSAALFVLALQLLSHSKQL